MKRIAIMMLALMLACAGVAQAAEWTGELGPSRPYENEPEINLDETLGYMMFYPSDGLRAQGACQELYIYLPREDVTAGEATLYLLTEEDGEVWSTAMNNTEAVTCREITEEELDGLLWGGGTCFEIRLPKTLELGKNYFVNLERGCIVAENGVENVSIGGNDSWSFSLEGEYGVSGMDYRRKSDSGKVEEQQLIPQAGDEIHFDLVLGGNAAMAAIYQFGDSVEFVMTTFTESCEVTGTVTTDSPIWGVVFLDEQGGMLQQVMFR